MTEETAVSQGDQGLPGSVVPGRMWLCIYRSSGSGVCCGLSSLSVRCHLVSLSCLFELVLSLPVCEGMCGVGVDGVSLNPSTFSFFALCLCKSLQLSEPQFPQVWGTLRGQRLN